jgi:hypothetical protein
MAMNPETINPMTLHPMIIDLRIESPRRSLRSIGVVRRGFGTPLGRHEDREWVIRMGGGDGFIGGGNG